MTRRRRTGPDRIDILPSSRVRRVGRRWTADIHIRAGAYQAAAYATTGRPSSAVASALAAACREIERDVARTDAIGAAVVDFRSRMRPDGTRLP